MDIGKRLHESLLDEDYPNTWDIEAFKQMTSFSKRIKYCEANLTRLGSGSARIVYQIDDEKVLKLAKNKKGLAQNEVEIEYGGYYDIDDIVAKTYDNDPNNLWVEMELARKLSKPIFKSVTGFPFEVYGNAIHNHGIDSGNGTGQKYPVDKAVVEAMWEDEFVYSMFNFIGNYGIPVGDLTRLSTYGVVKRDGQDTIVMVDYGLNKDVHTSYYSR